MSNHSKSISAVKSLIERSINSGEKSKSPEADNDAELNSSIDEDFKNKQIQPLKLGKHGTDETFVSGSDSSPKNQATIK